MKANLGLKLHIGQANLGLSGYNMMDNCTAITTHQKVLMPRTHLDNCTAITTHQKVLVKANLGLLLDIGQTLLGLVVLLYPLYLA